MRTEPMFKLHGYEWIKNEFDMIGIEINDTKEDINSELIGYFPHDYVEEIDIEFKKDNKYKEYNFINYAYLNDQSRTNIAKLENVTYRGDGAGDVDQNDYFKNIYENIIDKIQEDLEFYMRYNNRNIS